MNDLKSGSNLEKILKAGHFAFTGECGPPKGANVEHLKEKAAHLKGVVDAVNLTDNQTAVVRMSSWAAATILIQEGIEPNFQLVCRDRNRLAIQSDLLGVYAMGGTIPRLKMCTT
jgi:methylenetetrahydrofolate reductase (NADPH)